MVRKLELITPFVDERENRPSRVENGKNKKWRKNHD